MTNYDFIIEDDTKNEFMAHLEYDCNWQFEKKKDKKGYEFVTSMGNILLPWKHTDCLKSLPENKYNNDLIYGQDCTEGVVSVTAKEKELVLYFVDGTTKTLPMVYWILGPRPYDSKFTRLDGNLHYKYMRVFATPKAYYGVKRKLKGKDIYTVNNPVEAAMIYYGLTYFKGLVVDDVDILSFDIEGAGLIRDENSKTFLITNTLRTAGGEIVRKHFRVDEYEDNHKTMIDDWCRWVVKQDPKIITGHNINGYDLPYLKHCYGDDLPLGMEGKPIKTMPYTSSFRVDGNTAWDYNKLLCDGREIIDGMFLAVRYDIGRNYVSWGLKSIIDHEGLEREDRQHYDASKIAKNWHIPEEREKIVQYGMHDGDDSLAVLDLMVPSQFYMAQSVPKPFQVMTESATGSQLNALLVRSYLNDGHSIPKANPGDNEYVAGGMSHGIPGIYENVVKLDAKSYYPSTVLTFKIYDREKDPKAYYYEAVKHFTHKRFYEKDMYKKTGDKYYNDLQASSKIGINSFYGLFSTPGLNFNSFDCGRQITRCCRAGLQKAIEWATGKSVHYWWPEYKEKRTSTQDFENYDYIDSEAKIKYEDMPKYDHILTGIDTDALAFCKKDLSPFSDKEHEKMMNELNDIMYSDWEDDGYFEKFLVIKAKNYVMKEKGSDSVKMKGSSILDQKKEPALREFMNKIIDDLLDTRGKNVVSLYELYIKEAINIEDISRWTTKKSITKKVLNPQRANEQKVLDAVKHTNIQEGDKVWLFTALDGMKQKVVKGEPQFKKNGEPKLEENRILKLSSEWNSGEEDKMHYVKRVYNTIKIMENVIDMDQIVKYHNKSNKKLLKELCNKE